ncbi:hypothetical protein SSPSH_002831, partial [Salinisphaera shabanensis E1L3A]
MGDTDLPGGTLYRQAIAGTRALSPITYNPPLIALAVVISSVACYAGVTVKSG